MTTTWYVHTECDNNPPHVQGFTEGPAAGVRCEGCGRPTDIRYDWEPAQAEACMALVAGRDTNILGNLEEIRRLELVQAELSSLCDQTMLARDQYKRERDAEADENRRMRPVVETARAMRAAQLWGNANQARTKDELLAQVEAYAPIATAFEVAVDAYEAGAA